MALMRLVATTVTTISIFIHHATASPCVIEDLSGDSVVGGADLGLLLAMWTQQESSADLNGDGIVDGADLGMLLQNWGMDGQGLSDPPPVNQQPAPKTGAWVRSFEPVAPPVNVTITGSFPGFVVTNSADGMVLRVVNTQPLYNNAASLTVTTAFAPDAHGFDLKYTITNPSPLPQPLPNLMVRGLQIGNQIEALNAWSFGTWWDSLSWEPGVTTTTGQVKYPQIRYAPMAIVRDGNVATCLSVKYPVLEYKHDISPIFKHTATSTDGWSANCNMFGEIQPGETRQYTMMIRYAAPEDWIHTLEDYRDYLWGVYGDEPKYTQDLRPVRRWNSGGANLCDFGTNPRGFNTAERPDLNGWGPAVANLREELVLDGYERFMGWAAAGFYCLWQANNFCPQVMTNWLSPMLDSDDEWVQMHNDGFEVGFWIGETNQHADQWEDPVFDPVDVTNPAHVAAKLLEVTLAHDRGCDAIGLDSFRDMNLWDAMYLLNLFQAAAPNIKFIGEPTSNDVMHMAIPLFVNGQFVPTAPLLADYLVPQREIWAHLFEADGGANLCRASQLTGWGMSVVTGTLEITAHDLTPAVIAAQNGWVLSPDAEAPDGPLHPAYGQ